MKQSPVSSQIRSSQEVKLWDAEDVAASHTFSRDVTQRVTFHARRAVAEQAARGRYGDADTEIARTYGVIRNLRQTVHSALSNGGSIQLTGKGGAFDVLEQICTFGESDATGWAARSQRTALRNAVEHPDNFSGLDTYASQRDILSRALYSVGVLGVGQEALITREEVVTTMDDGSQVTTERFVARWAMTEAMQAQAAVPVAAQAVI